MGHVELTLAATPSPSKGKSSLHKDRARKGYVARLSKVSLAMVCLAIEVPPVGHSQSGLPETGRCLDWRCVWVCGTHLDPNPTTLHPDVTSCMGVGGGMAGGTNSQGRCTADASTLSKVRRCSKRKREQAGEFFWPPPLLLALNLILWPDPPGLILPRHDPPKCPGIPPFRIKSNLCLSLPSQPWRARS